MHGPAVARDPPRPRARLNLAPRLHPDETLSSWLERFAGAYGMTLGEFFLWLGYRNFLGYHEVPHDLDVSPPPDLAGVLALHTGLSAELLAAHRMEAFDALPPRWRRTFCPECWIEEGPYRRFEWAHNLSLVCPRHRRFLSERPLRREGPFLPWHEESWTEFYHDTNAWRDLRPSWDSEPWIRICAALGVEPHAEFLRAWPWLIELSRGAPAPWDRARPSAPAPCDDPHDPASAQDSRGGEDVRVAEVTAKQDMALYAMIQFYDFSLLQALDETVSEELMVDKRGELCDVRSPEVPYFTRLFAATVARHLWVRITQGEWRCGRAAALERTLRREERFDDELWWLEQRFQTWPQALEAAGRQLFQTRDPFPPVPPWQNCRECIREHGGSCRTRAGRSKFFSLREHRERALHELLSLGEYGRMVAIRALFPGETGEEICRAWSGPHLNRT